MSKMWEEVKMSDWIIYCKWKCFLKLLFHDRYVKKENYGHCSSARQNLFTCWQENQQSDKRVYHSESVWKEKDYIVGK